MNYVRTFWWNRLKDQLGNILRKGTPLDQDHFNNLEKGVSCLFTTVQTMLFKQNQDEHGRAAEVKQVTLAMHAGAHWPFNNKETTVGLKMLRETTNYAVDVSVEEYSGGLIGNIRVTDKAKNGFKLVHDGSATNVKVTVRVTGGMME